MLNRMTYKGKGKKFCQKKLLLIRHFRRVSEKKILVLFYRVELVNSKTPICSNYVRYSDRAQQRSYRNYFRIIVCLYYIANTELHEQVQLTKINHKYYA
jgi:hypothetical protein